MEPVFIVLISAGVVFAFLVLIYVLYANEKMKIDRRKQQELDNAYADVNLAKMDYNDSGVVETEKRNAADQTGQVTFDDIIKQDPLKSEKSGSEGVEEITGNFKG